MGNRPKMPGGNTQQKCSGIQPLTTKDDHQMSPHDFKVKYIKGKDNILADCMSCLPAGSVDQIYYQQVKYNYQGYLNCITSKVQTSDLQIQ